MLFTPKDDDEEKNDYFDSDGIPEEPVKEPEKPKYRPEDPAYWDEDESEWEHLRPRRRWMPWFWTAAVLVVAALLAGCWIRFFSPYVEDAVQYGYVEHIEKRGAVFKTYEGVLIPYKELMDTTRIYSRDFIFSAADATVATRLKLAQRKAMPVMVEYKRYHATLPWRGASKIVVTAVDSVDPAKILPPEFAPRR